eukprot:3385598-Pyramimonas_sp.AAC.1
MVCAVDAVDDGQLASIPDDLVDPHDEIIGVCRALLALVDPRPRKSFSEVEKIFAPAEIAKRRPEVQEFLMSVLSSPWQSLLD